MGGAVAGVILAGGAGRRMGGLDKAALRVGGVSLLDRVLGAAQPVAHRPGGGPVPAIAAGLDAVADAAVALVLAVDLPLLEAVHLRAVLAALDAGAEAAAAGAEGGPNPLLAAYPAPALAARVGALGAGARAAALLPPHVVIVDLGRATLNVNRPEDLAVAERVAATARRYARPSGSPEVGR
ncbi:MAG TPA: NTP transferase domain-containing protein [Acidimicrobiales bacterium]|nr:NTP transferase domain-containing protein [Acidimicrobiales bacterium]